MCEYGEQCVEVVHAWRRVVWGVQKGEGGLGGGISLVCVCVFVSVCVCVCVWCVGCVCVCVYGVYESVSLVYMCVYYVH